MTRSSTTGRSGDGDRSWLATPFADVGRVVAGRRFVGRLEQLSRVRARVLGDGSRGNVAILGLPRIGKSSLAWNAVMAEQNALLDRGTLAVWIDMGDCSDGAGLFRALVYESRRILEERGRLSPAVALAAEPVLGATDTGGMFSQIVRKYFLECTRAGVRTVFVLDEFDHARTIWSKQPAAFQLLRSLSYSPDRCDVTFVMTCRRRVEAIETAAGVTSTFAGICKDEWVTLFDAEEAIEALARLREAGVSLDASEEALVLELTGRHPFLMDHAFFEAASAPRSGADFAALCEKVARHEFLDYYANLEALMTEGGLFGKLVQVLYGPAFDVSASDLDGLMRYGLVHDTGAEFATWSGHFQGYLETRARRSSIWPTWSRTETSLREVVERELIGEYGEEWIAALLRAHPALASAIEGCRERSERESARYGSQVGGSVLDYSYPQDLASIIARHWARFEPILGGTKEQWLRRFDTIAKVRAPIAHNRQHRVPSGLVKEAEGICDQILERLSPADPRRRGGPSNERIDGAR